MDGMFEKLPDGPRKEARSSIIEHSEIETASTYPEDNKVAEEPAQDLDSWGFGIKKKKSIKSKKLHEEVTTRRDKLWREFENACSAGFSARKDWPAGKSCTGNVFLLHARLYTFAHCYEISGLVDLSFYKLGKALVDIELDSDKVEDVVDVLQYCYDELASPKLRSLLVLYAACKVETLWKSSKFRELLGRQSELSTALIGAMIDRLD
jgi:hypothetical protein